MNLATFLFKEVSTFLQRCAKAGVIAISLTGQVLSNITIVQAAGSKPDLILETS